MKHTKGYYTEKIELLVDELTKSQEVQIDRTKFLVVKLRIKDVKYIAIASEYNNSGIHCWIYNTNTKQIETILKGTKHYVSRFKERYLAITRLSDIKQLAVCIHNMFEFAYNTNNKPAVYITDRKLSKDNIPIVTFVTYYRAYKKK